MDLRVGLIADRSFRVRSHLDTFLRGVPSEEYSDAFARLAKHYQSGSIPSATSPRLLIRVACDCQANGCWRGRIKGLIRANWAGRTVRGGNTLWTKQPGLGRMPSQSNVLQFLLLL